MGFACTAVLTVFAPFAMAATGGASGRAAAPGAASGSSTPSKSVDDSHAVISQLEPFHIVTEADIHKFTFKNGTGGYAGVLEEVIYSTDGDGVIKFLFACQIGNPQPQSKLISQFSTQDQKYIKAWADEHAPEKVFSPPVFVPGTTYLAHIPDIGDSLRPYLFDTSGVLKGKTIASISGGVGINNLALCTDGTLAACGLDEAGELGDGRQGKIAFGSDMVPAFSLVPVLVYTKDAMKGKKVIAIESIGAFRYVLCSDGSLFTWGFKQDTPQLVTNGPLKNKHVTGLVGGWAFCADGTMVDLLYNANKQTAINQGVLRGKVVTAMTEYAGHTVALCSDNTLAQWKIIKSSDGGAVPVPELFTPPDPDGVLKGKTIASIGNFNDSKNDGHLAVLCSDGTLALWALPPLSSPKSKAIGAPQTPGAATGARRGMAATRNPVGLTARGNATPNGKTASPADMASLRPPTLLSGTGLLASKTVTGIYDYNRIACSDGTLIVATNIQDIKLVLADSTGYFQGKKILSIVDNDILFQEPGPQAGAVPAPGAAP
jgi:hypothetical protein